MKSERGAQRYTLVKSKRSTKGRTGVPLGTPRHPAVPWDTLVYAGPGVHRGVPQGSPGGTLGYLANSVWGGAFFHLWFSPPNLT